MFLHSIRSAFPGRPYSQAEIWELIRDSGAGKRVGRRGRKILEAVLGGDSGIDARYFSVPPPDLFELGPDDLNRAFEREAPALGGQALSPALADAGVSASQLDALFVCTCTGYLCPGVSGHIAERLGLRPDASLFDFAGSGCGAAVPTMQAAGGFLAQNPGASVAVVAVEVCSAAFDLGEDTGVLVGACLFGDGASASIWKSEPGNPGFGNWKAARFRQHHAPSERERIRFVKAGGKLRIQLARSVPEAAAEAVIALHAKLEKRPDAVLAHPGGKDVIGAVEKALGRPLPETREAMRRYGNLSSPSVLVALEDRLKAPAEDIRDIWLCAFGAGFSAYGCNLVRED